MGQVPAWASETEAASFRCDRVWPRVPQAQRQPEQNPPLSLSPWGLPLWSTWQSAPLERSAPRVGGGWVHSTPVSAVIV